MDNELINKLNESLKKFQEILKNHSFFYRGYFIGLFIYVEQLMDCLIAAHICESAEGERSDLVIAIMDFIKTENKITILSYIMNRHHKLELQKDYGFKYLKNEHGKNDFITALKKAYDIRNSFSHHIIGTPEQSKSIPFMIDMFKRTGLRNNKNNDTEIIEFRSTKSFSSKELELYTKELTDIINILMKLCKELIEEK